MTTKQSNAAKSTTTTNPAPKAKGKKGVSDVIDEAKAKEAAATPPPVTAKRAPIWVRNAFCVGKDYAGDTILFQTTGPDKGTTVAAKIVSKGGDRFQMKAAGQDKPVMADRSCIFPNQKAADDAMAWAKELLMQPGVDFNPETDFGNGESQHDHTGRLVAVYRPGDATYGLSVSDRGFMLGFLNTDTVICDEEDIATRGEEGPAGSVIPFYRPVMTDGKLDHALTRVTVWYPFVSDPLHVTGDWSVPVNCLYSPMLVTDAFAAFFGIGHVRALASANGEDAPPVKAKGERKKAAPKAEKASPVEEKPKAAPIEVKKNKIWLMNWLRNNGARDVADRLQKSEAPADCLHGKKTIPEEVRAAVIEVFSKK